MPDAKIKARVTPEAIEAVRAHLDASFTAAAAGCFLSAGLPPSGIPESIRPVVTPDPAQPPAPATTAASPIRIFHRIPDSAALLADKRAPRAFTPDDVMAIEPRALERAFSPMWSDDEEKPYDTEGAVAIICIDGPLSQRGGWWWDGYESIQERFEAALEDDSVGAVVLKINSPGGVCSGCFSTARAMIAAKQEAGKPVYAFADEAAYSAAFAMACVADEIYLPREGGVGSVGVLGVLEDWTAYNDKLGIRVAVLTSGAQKADGYPDVPLTKDVISRYQARIDSLADSFFEIVAGARGMTPEAVQKLQAACLYGEQAVKGGLANAVTTLDDVILKAAGEAARRFNSTTARPAPRKGPTMGDQNKTPGSNDGDAPKGGVLQAIALGEPVSFGDIAVAAGVAHDAGKTDIIASVTTLRTKASYLDKLVSACGAKTFDEAVGKLEADKSNLEAERKKVDELLVAIMGPSVPSDQRSVAAALAKFTADQAEALIEAAKAAGKNADEKARAIFAEFGVGALRAHIDALVPAAALTAPAPQQLPPKGATPDAETGANGEIKLSADDERVIAKHGLDRAAFIAARKIEIADAKANREKRDS